jgi:asparagine synthase (glutamine-hydrolysing)
LPAAVSNLGTSWRRRQLADLLAAPTRQELYRRLVSICRRPEELVTGAQEPPTALSGPLPRGVTAYGAEMSFLDLVSYLPDDILVKVDRASMGVSLEGRVPMLDHRLVELAASLPEDLKVREGKQKWILRQVLYRHVPAEMVERPKMGFGVPMAAWIRGPLREWASDLLAEERVRSHGLFEAPALSALLRAHLSGAADHQAVLWHALVFQAWMESARA